MKSASSKKLKSLLNQAEAFNESRNYIYFDRIWGNPENIRKCAELFYEEILILNKKASFIQNPNPVILSADSAGGNMGIIPVSFFVAEKLNCPATIWKELANIQWGTAAILGNPKPNQSCILLQDVVDHGTTIVKVAHTVKELNWKLILYLTGVINNKKGVDDVNMSLDIVENLLGERPKFHYIASIEELT